MKMDETVKKEEERIGNPALEVDLRLTMREWVIYWKTKYEEALHKIVGAQKAFRLLKQENEKLTQEILTLRSGKTPPATISINRTPVAMEKYLEVKEFTMTVELNGQTESQVRKIDWNPEKNFPSSVTMARDILMCEAKNAGMALVHNLIEGKKDGVSALQNRAEKNTVPEVQGATGS